MTTRVVPSVESIVADFPRKINKIHGLPTFETLRALRKDLQLNAASVQCTLGGGAHGYLGLILDAAAYAIVAGNNAAGNAQPFINPTFPGDLPTLVGADKDARDQELRVFNHQAYAWRMYDNVHQALRSLVVDNIENTYLSPLYSQITGYRNVTLNAMLAHLFNEYIDVGPNDLHENEKRMTKAWDGAEPFENIITRFDDCIDYARTSLDPFSAETILNKAKQVVYETGIYYDAMEEWDGLAIAKTWDTFKEFILTAQRKLRKRTATSKQHGYGLAIQKMTELADGVANAVNADHAKYEAARVQSNATEAKQAAAIATLTAELTLIRKQYADVIARLPLPNANSMPMCPPVAAPVAAPAAAPKERYKRVPKDEGSYCHTHGFWVSKVHNSANCKFQKEGHQATATRANTMGGCEHGRPLA
jgi:hypothetical protein